MDILILTAQNGATSGLFKTIAPFALVMACCFEL